MYTEVRNYRKFIEELPLKIKKSSFKASGIINKTGIPKASFYEKLKSNKFSLSEVEKIAKVLFLEEQIDRALRLSEEDIINGRLKEFNLYE